jgi:hypothetical protein
MNVKQLLKKLREVDQNLPIVLSNGKHFYRGAAIQILGICDYYDDIITYFKNSVVLFKYGKGKTKGILVHKVIDKLSDNVNPSAKIIVQSDCGIFGDGYGYFNVSDIDIIAPLASPAVGFISKSLGDYEYNL